MRRFSFAKTEVLESDVDVQLLNLYPRLPILEQRCVDSLASGYEPDALEPPSSPINRLDSTLAATPESVLEGLPKEYFTPEYDPVEPNLLEISEWEPESRVENFMSKIEEADTDKDVIIGHLTTMIDANYSDLMECMRNVQQIDVDLCHAGLQIGHGRRKIRSACDIIHSGAIKIKELNSKRSELLGTLATIRSVKALTDVHKAMLHSMSMGDLGKAAEYAHVVLDCLKTESYEQFDALKSIGSSMPRSIVAIRQKSDKALKRLCTRKFATSDYENIITAYAILDQISAELNMSLHDAGDGGMSAAGGGDLDFYFDSVGCLEGLSQRINRFQLEDIDGCIHSAVMEHIYATQQKKQRAAAQIDIAGAYLQMNMGEIVDLAEVPLNLLYRRLSPDNVAPCIVRCCELLADVVHTQYLITQWHNAPFDEQNLDWEFLHRCPIDLPEKQEQQQMDRLDELEREVELQASSPKPSSIAAASGAADHTDDEEEERASDGDVSGNYPAGGGGGTHKPFSALSLPEPNTTVSDCTSNGAKEGRNRGNGQQRGQGRGASPAEIMTCFQRNFPTRLINSGRSIHQHSQQQKQQQKQHQGSPRTGDTGLSSTSESADDKIARIILSLSVQQQYADSTPALPSSSSTSTSTSTAAVTAAAADRYPLAKVAMAQVQRSLGQSRSILWEEMMRALVNMLNSVTFTSEVKLEEFLALAWALNSMVQLGKEFCGSESPALTTCLSDKSLEYFHHFHLESFFVVREMVDAESWFNVPMELDERGGIIGIVKSTLSRAAVASGLIYCDVSASSVVNSSSQKQQQQEEEEVVVVASKPKRGKRMERRQSQASTPLAFLTPTRALEQESEGQGNAQVHAQPMSILMKFGFEGNPFHFMTQQAEESQTPEISGTADTAGSSAQTRDEMPPAAPDQGAKPQPPMGGFWGLLNSQEKGENTALAAAPGSEEDLVITQAALNGLVKYVAKYMHLMYLLPAASTQIFQRLRQLFDYYFCAVYFGFMPPEERSRFLCVPTKFTALPSEQAHEFETLRNYLFHALDEVVSKTPPSRSNSHAADGSGGALGALLDASDHSNNSSSHAGTSPSPSTSNNSGHGGIYRTYSGRVGSNDGTGASANASSGAGAGAEAKRLAQLLRPLSIMVEEDGCFALSERLVAAESCFFVAKVFKDIGPKLLRLVPADSTAAVQTAVNEYSAVARELKSLLIKGGCPLLLKQTTILPQILDCGWDSKKMKDNNNPWVGKVVANCAQVWEYLSTSNGMATFSAAQKEQVWVELCQAAFDLALDGFSRVRKVSSEGRAAMSVDIVALHDGLNHVHLCRPARGKRYVDNYLRASYLGEEDLLNWVRQNWQAYAYRHVHGLLSQTLTASLLSSKRFKEAVAVIDSLYVLKDEKDVHHHGGGGANIFSGNMSLSGGGGGGGVDGNGTTSNSSNADGSGGSSGSNTGSSNAAPSPAGGSSSNSNSSSSGSKLTDMLKGDRKITSRFLPGKFRL